MQEISHKLSLGTPCSLVILQCMEFETDTTYKISFYYFSGHNQFQIITNIYVCIFFLYFCVYFELIKTAVFGQNPCFQP